MTIDIVHLITDVQKLISKIKDNNSRKIQLCGPTMPDRQGIDISMLEARSTRTEIDEMQQNVRHSIRIYMSIYNMPSAIRCHLFDQFVRHHYLSTSHQHDSRRSRHSKDVRCTCFNLTMQRRRALWDIFIRSSTAPIIDRSADRATGVQVAMRARLPARRGLVGQRSRHAGRGDRPPSTTDMPYCLRLARLIDLQRLPVYPRPARLPRADGPGADRCTRCTDLNAMEDHRRTLRCTLRCKKMEQKDGAGAGIVTTCPPDKNIIVSGSVD